MKKHRVLNIVIAAVLLPALLPALVAGAPVARAERVEADVQPLVWETLRADGQAEVIVIMRVQADLSGADALPTKEAKGRYVRDALWQVAQATQHGLRAELDAQGVEYQSFYVVNALKVRAGEALVRSLAARGDVARIVANPWVRGVPDRPAGAPAAAPAAVEPNLARVGAPEVWAMGYTGEGVVVAGNDTGIDWDHPALVDQYRPQFPGYGRHDFNWHDAIHSGGGGCGANSPEPCDDYGHGTHTLGTMIGDDGGANQIGMAPGAQWIGCRNMNVGVGSPATYLECFEFFMAPYPLDGQPEDGDPDLAPDVINNSWGCPGDEGCDAGTLEGAVDALRQAGVVVVVSAGNSGSSCGSINTPPAIYRQSFTVGAFSHTNDQIAGFSSRGPVTYGGETYIKPDIAAPGVGIRSSVPGGIYEGGWSGTSMAAPHVAGAVALLLSAAPGYRGQVTAIEQALIDTVEPKTSTQCGTAGPPNNVWGWGILDAQAAVELVTSGSLHGAVTNAGTGAPVGGALIQADPPGGPEGPRATTGADGQYNLVLAAGTYDVTVGAAGYLTETVPGLVVTGTSVLNVELAPIGVPPEAVFETNSPVCLGEPLVVTNTSTLADAWWWTFGDGSGSGEWAPAHTYDAAGAYTVTLVVTNAVGSASLSSDVEVKPLPEASFSWSAADLTVSLSNTSLDAGSYLWSFGDGVTSTLPAPTHTYEIAGSYPVTLTAYNGCGQDGATATVEVHAPGVIWRVYVPIVWKSAEVAP